MKGEMRINACLHAIIKLFLSVIIIKNGIIFTNSYTSAVPM